MRKLAVLALFAVVGFTLNGCSSGGGSTQAASTQAPGTPCWNTGVGLVIESISTTVPGCTASYADGNPVVSGPVAGDTPANAFCTYSFPNITWYVWETDGGASGNAQAFCYTLAAEQGATS
jgi:hypothetical protein